jgi:pimeloyl-ACP methyl ester carboxylesterase
VPLIEARAHVYLCALLPTPRRPAAEVFSEALDPSFGGTEYDVLGRSFWPNLDVAAERLYQGHERRWAKWAFPQLRPQSQTAARKPHPLTELPSTPVAYVVAREDPAVRPEWSRAVARDALGVEPLEVAGGHFPMFDRSVELADLLERVLERAT